MLRGLDRCKPSDGIGANRHCEARGVVAKDYACHLHHIYKDKGLRAKMTETSNFACKLLDACGLFSVIPGIFAWRGEACVKAMGMGSKQRGLIVARHTITTDPNKCKPHHHPNTIPSR